MYDFDRDGLISKEDIELVLSHVPLIQALERKDGAAKLPEKIEEQVVDNSDEKEGMFTQEGGGQN